MKWILVRMKLMNKIHQIKNKMKYILGIHVYDKNFPQSEDVGVEIINKKVNEFNISEAMNCLDGNYKNKVTSKNINTFLDELVDKNILHKINDNKYKFKD